MARDEDNRNRKYYPRTTPLFEKNFERLTKKDSILRERLLKKVMEIIDNPEIGEHLTRNLAGMCSVHVGHWVIIYEVRGDEIHILNVDHHDYAYFQKR
jgi:addiction module RelE/StbE family toxin